MPEYPPVIYFSNKTDADSASVSGDIYTALAASKTYVVGHTDPLFFSFHHAALDTSGNMYVPDTWNHVIRKIVISTGVVSTLAGTGQQGYVDGSGNLAKFSTPEGIVYDNSGNLYVADSSNSVIRKIVISSAQVSTFAGTPEQQGYADGSGNLAQFSYPSGITLDTSGNMYVSDAGLNQRIRKIVISTAVVSTLAGSGEYGYEDGSGNSAKFANPFAIVYDNSGNLYVADTNNGAIRKIVISTGEVSTFAGTGAGGYVNGSGNLAQFNRSEGIAYDNSGNLYVADGNNQRIRKIVISSGQVSTLTGSGQQGYLDGSGNLAQFNYPRGVVYDNSGNLYVFESGIYAIRKVVISTGEVSTFAGMPDLRGYADTNMVIPTKWKISPSSTGTGDQSYVWNNGITLDPATGIYFLYPMPSGSVCFLQGTTVLCLVNGYDMYVPVEELTKDSLVKTLLNGYKKVELIGKEVMNNPGTDERIQNRLYKCTPAKYPELVTDLYITGCHSILVNTITDQQKDGLVENLGRIFVTDKKYRLIACVDERAEPWNSEGEYTVWHFALENDNIHMNYGVYVNGGLLVESCGIHVLKNKSNMVLL